MRKLQTTVGRFERCFPVRRKERRRSVGYVVTEGKEGKNGYHGGEE